MVKPYNVMFTIDHFNIYYHYDYDQNEIHYFIIYNYLTSMCQF